MKKIKALTDKSVRLLFTGDLVGVSPTRLSMKNLKYAIIGYDVYKLYAQALSTRKKYLITRTVFIIKGTYEQNIEKRRKIQKNMKKSKKQVEKGRFI